MDISLHRNPQFSWPVTAATPKPRSIPLSQRSLRLLIVLALYGITVFTIHGLAAEFRTHAAATSSDMGMCHRH
jgi:hypothetical protein